MYVSQVTLRIGPELGYRERVPLKGLVVQHSLGRKEGW